MIKSSHLPSDPAPPQCPMCGAVLAEANADCAQCGEREQGSNRPSRRFRWRIIPTFFLGLFAALMFAGALAQIAMLLFFLATKRMNFTAARTSLSLGELAMELATSLVWGVAARLWWRGRWWWAAGATIFGYLAGLLCLWLFGRL